MAKTITISVDYNGDGSTNHKLSLTDSEGHIGSGDGSNKDGITTNVGVGDTIQWVIAPNSKVTAITAITAKDGNPDFLDNKTQEPSTGNFIAVVKAGFNAHSIEAYNISYTISGDTTIYIDDPKLDMDPST